MGLPALDTVLSASRRLLDRRHPFSRDADHIHHRLEQMELGPRGILVAVYALSALFALAALGTHFVGSVLQEGLILLALLVLVALVLSKLGYILSMWNSSRLISLRRRLARN
jgi:UDP-GlcNAc:undecaprenyl-phosphate GlcNAc-1-phosphate transferase